VGGDKQLFRADVIANACLDFLERRIQFLSAVANGSSPSAATVTAPNELISITAGINRVRIGSSSRPTVVAATDGGWDTTFAQEFSQIKSPNLSPLAGEWTQAGQLVSRVAHDHE
jgi:hypothetical protein